LGARGKCVEQCVLARGVRRGDLLAEIVHPMQHGRAQHDRRKDAGDLLQIPISAMRRAALSISPRMLM
jgi:hypothetical protein